MVRRIIAIYDVVYEERSNWPLSTGWDGSYIKFIKDTPAVGGAPRYYAVFVWQAEEQPWLSTHDCLPDGDVFGGFLPTSCNMFMKADTELGKDTAELSFDLDKRDDDNQLFLEYTMHMGKPDTATPAVKLHGFAKRRNAVEADYDARQDLKDERESFKRFREGRGDRTGYTSLSDAERMRLQT